MPPAYPIFLYLIKLISFNNINFINLAILLQVILSTYSVYIFYKINNIFFPENISIINSFIFSYFPLNIYAAAKISSISLQIFFSLLFLQFLFLLTKNQTLKNIIFFSIISGLLILTRSEFILIFLAIIFLCFLFKKIKLINLLKIILIILIVVSPYVIRNYIHFNQILLVKSVGFNLWKGNNELSLVQGYETYEDYKFNKLHSKLNNLKMDKFYEINRDDVFFIEAKRNIRNDPLRYFVLSIKKFFSFYFVDLNSKYQNYYNIINFLPTLLISILSLPGLVIFFKKKDFNINCLGIYLLSNLIIFSVFFILPRYKLVILPIQIILLGYFIQYLMNKLKFK